MPRVNFVKAARKDNPAVKAGESYYWWKFRYGGKHYSRTRPRPSQLTGSAYRSGVLSLIERVEDWDSSEIDFDAFVDIRDEIVEQIRELGEQAQESLDNMPEGLQEGDTGQLLQARYEACEQAADEIEYAEADGWETYESDKEAFDEWVQDEPEEDEFETKDDFEQEFENWERRDPGDPDDEVSEFDKEEWISLLDACVDPY